MPRIYFDDDYDFPEYITVEERRRKAQREAEKLGGTSPVVIAGSQIARTFWGKSWCQNLERYSDYANRLPRGRTYVRSGCVVHLQIAAGNVKAFVSGSRLYNVEVKVSPIPKPRWKALCHDCAGAIDSLVELLEGRFPKVTMERLCRQTTGLFPSPAEMKFDCTCPDSARMCKHMAAVLYGIGARLDDQPALLFTLREVNQQDLIMNAGQAMTKRVTARILETRDLSELFGIDIAEPKPRRRKAQKRRSARE
jgi:uncharacterized Zn finger protein